MVAREWSYLDPLRSLCELEGIPVQMANEEFSGVRNLWETRARQTLTPARFPGPHHFQDALRGNPSVLVRQEPARLSLAPPELERRYRRLSLSDVFLSFAGYRPSGHPVHRAIAALSPGDFLQVRVVPNRWEILDGNGTVVGQLAAGFNPPSGMRPAFATVWAIATWDRQRSEPQYQDGFRCDSWEVVVPELVFEPDYGPADAAPDIAL